MNPVEYLDIEQAREALKQVGIELTPRQMKRAADKDAHGARKLPFFIDPIDGRLKIAKNTLLGIYFRRQVDAENKWKINPVP